ncbi:methyltransferase domain-containing protein [Streptomyces sp. NPDC054796]
MTAPSEVTVGTADVAALRAACGTKIDRIHNGYLRHRPWLREAFQAVPREHFVPDRVWSARPRTDGLHRVIDRAKQPDVWLKRIYEPLDALITQVADGSVLVEDGPTDAEWTSSISCASVCVSMLHHLAPRPGEKVLEIGTGTGYTAALLSHRIGDTHVTSVEIDPGIASRAEENLRALDLNPHLVVGDGEKGWPAGAPYDRLISTAAVRRIPPAWPQQVRRGGVIITPLSSPFGCDGLCRLVCDGEGDAKGNLISGVTFMKVRGQREQCSFRDLGWPEWSDYQVTVQGGEQRIRTSG